MNSTSTEHPPGRRVAFGWEAVSVLVARVIVLLAQFCSSLLIARLLGPAGRGLVSSLTVPTQLSIGLSELGVRQSIAYHIGKGLVPAERMIPTLLVMIPMASAVGVLFSVGYYEFAGVADGHWGYRALALATIPVSLTVSYAGGVFLGRRRIGEFRKTSWRPAIINVALVALLGYGLSLNVYGVLLASLGAAASAAVYALYLLRDDGPLRPGFDRQLARQLTRKGLGYAAALFLLGLNYKVMILLLTKIGNLHDVGIYAQATVIAELLWEIPNVLGAILLSRSVNARDERAFSLKAAMLARTSFVVAAFGSVVMIAIAPSFFALAYGIRFRESGTVCAILLPGIAAFIFFKIIHTDLSGRGKPWAAMIVIVPALVVNLIGGAFAIERYGVVGAAAVSSLVYAGSSIAYVFVYTRITGLSLSDVLLFRGQDISLIRQQIASVRRSRVRPTAPAGPATKT